jgi:hypothetical protein
VLQKVGIVTATAAAGLLALSPLALAGDYDGDDDGGHSHSHHSRDHDGDHDHYSRSSVNVQRGLINLQNVGVQVPIQACNNSLLGGVLGILSSGQSSRDDHRGSCKQGNSSDN